MPARVQAAPAIIVALCLAAAGGGIAAAMEPPAAAEAKITIKSPAPSTFKGMVSSDNPVCVKGRSVKLRTAGGKEISGAITGKRGNWRVGLEGTLKGSYYAKVTSRRVGGFVCRAARSATVPAA